MEIKTANVKEMEVKTVENLDGEQMAIVQKPKVRDRIANSKPIGFVRRHAKGFAAGFASTVAVGAAAAIAAKMAMDGASEAPMIDVEGIVDSIPEPEDSGGEEI